VSGSTAAGGGRERSSVDRRDGLRARGFQTDGRRGSSGVDGMEGWEGTGAGCAERRGVMGAVRRAVWAAGPTSRAPADTRQCCRADW
jgi:hypothetical protein